MHVIDFEVFKYDWLCVIYDLSRKAETVIVNDRERLIDYYNQFKKEIFIGYNIREYDQYIFKAILLDYDPKDVNDFIIEKKRRGYQYSREFNKVELTFYDVMPEDTKVGLKTLEAFMGSDIRETTVPFNIDRKLTANEIAEVIFYCEHDVEETCKVLNDRIEDFTSHLEVVKTFNLPKEAMGKTQTQLAALALGAKRPFHGRGDELNFSIPKTLNIKKYKFIVDWFIECRDRALNNLKNGIDEKVVKDGFYKQKLKCEVAGVPHVFAWGGLHGAIPNYSGKGYFVNVDVASYYPTLMIEYGYSSRNIQNPNLYAEIYHTRLAYKAAKDKRQKPYKLILNKSYGATKFAGSDLYDPLQANNVCVAGQLWLVSLIEDLESRFDIIQSNTDGILVRLRASNEAEADREYEALDMACFKWEQRSKMTLEFDEFSQVIQRDVNNYIIVASDGSYKSKGGVVKKLSNLDYDLPIVNKAVVNKLIHDIPCEKTINECNDLREFQKIVKVSNLYLYAMHNGKQLSEKTFRVFASNRNTDGMIYKVKNLEKNPEKFANTPERCFIDNSNVLGKPVPEHLDKEWYIKTANERALAFLESKKGR